MFLDLAQGLKQYQASWGELPQHHVPSGGVLKPGLSGPRVNQLRTRLGLAPGNT